MAEPCDQKVTHTYIVVGNLTEMPSANTDLRESGRGRMDWIDLAQDKDRWRVFVNTVTNIWVP
jgi:hypothetical protein